MGQYYKPVILNDNDEVIAWAYSHDYNNGLKLMEHSWVGNDFVDTFASQLIPDGKFHQSRVAWAGDYADDNLYDQCKDDNKIRPDAVAVHETHPFVVNHTTKQYVDIRKTPFTDGTMQIHPLPILTSEGNGRGGGDLYNIESGDEGLIGLWSRNVISCEVEPPTDYTELIFDLVESW